MGGMPSPSGRRLGDRGMVTVELAVGLLTASLAVAVACWVVMLVVLQGRCEDVAGQVARQVARADSKAADQAKKRVPKGGRVDVRTTDEQVRVVVRASSSFGKLGSVQVEGTAVAKLEPGVGK
ncbi:TadE family type IV pilus minor pilin [Luteococcus sanguinis]|uniref:TadE family type IV pilus minor pilin n=1 Tax=Luteococcus sanguinis TaxID=174038 RepID=A0ABW1X0A2_9ACTN